jgi:hypothetical protein
LFLLAIFYRAGREEGLMPYVLRFVQRFRAADERALLDEVLEFPAGAAGARP